MPEASFSVGSIACRVLLDGEARYAPEDVFADVPREDWLHVIGDRLDADGYLPLPYQPVLIRTPQATMLVDAGAGTELAEEWEDPVGRVRGSLREAGFAPDDIQIVFITHAHPDHVGGLTEAIRGERMPVFGNARHVIARDEWEFWRSDDVPEPSSSMAPIVRAHLLPLAETGHLEFIDGDTEIVAGVRAIPTPGHTPGHMSLILSSEGRNGIVCGDAILTEASFEHPEWHGAAEVDPPRSVQTREALLARAADIDAILTAYHLRGIGHVRTTSVGPTFVPRE